MPMFKRRFVTGASPASCLSRKTATRSSEKAYGLADREAAHTPATPLMIGSPLPRQGVRSMT